jgi:hypothetical protein
VSNLVFCAHLARTIRLGLKTVTWKPLAPADLERRSAGYVSEAKPFTPGEVVTLIEPWGYRGGAVVYMSSFVNERQGAPFTIPDGFSPMQGTRGQRTLTIISCDLRNLHTLDEADARLAGAIPPDGEPYLVEFQRQWTAYRGLQAWDANPLCWRISFTLNPEV